MDTATGAETDLAGAPSYAFTFSAADPQRLRIRLLMATTGTESDAAEGPSLEAPRPNPARSSATVAFTLARSGPVRVVLLDALGWEAVVVADGRLAAGPHTLPANVDGLAAGVYLVRLKADGVRRTRRLAVVR